MSISSNYFKLGTTVDGYYAAGSSNGIFSVSGSVVSDTLTNPDYLVFNLTGAVPVAGQLSLPAKAGNYAFVSNQTGASITVYCGTSTSNGVTLVNTECSALFCNGTIYQKATAISATLDIGSYSATAALASTSLFIVKLIDGSTHSVTFATLAAMLGLASNSNVITAACCSTSNITLSGLQTLDGHTTLAGETVFVTGQSTPTLDGCYVASAGAWVRVGQMLPGSGASQLLIAVQFGANNSGLWICNNAQGVDIVGTSTITWRLFSAPTNRYLAPAAYIYTNNIALSGPRANQNSLTPANGLRALVNGQSTASQNGLYTVNLAGAWPRTGDLPTGSSAADTVVEVSNNGAGLGGSQWRCYIAPGSDVVGTNAIVWHQCSLDFSGASGSGFNDVVSDATSSNGPMVQSVSGNPATRTAPIKATLLRAPSPNAAIVAANGTISTEEETLVTPGGIVTWTHYTNANGRATKRAVLIVAEDYQPAPAGGVSTNLNLMQCDSFWQVHTGVIHVSVHCATTGRDFYRDISFSAIYGRRMRITDGNSSAGQPMIPNPNTSWWGSDGTNANAWPTSAGAGAVEPTLSITPNMRSSGGSNGQYWLTVTFGQYVNTVTHTEQIKLVVDVTATDSSVTEA